MTFCRVASRRARQVLDKYAKAVDYVMIDPREFWEYQPSASRALVDPSNAVLTAHSLPVSRRPGPLRSQKRHLTAHRIRCAVPLALLRRGAHALL